MKNLNKFLLTVLIALCAALIFGCGILEDQQLEVKLINISSAIQNGDQFAGSFFEVDAAAEADPLAISKKVNVSNGSATIKMYKVIAGARSDEVFTASATYVFVGIFYNKDSGNAYQTVKAEKRNYSGTTTLDFNSLDLKPFTGNILPADFDTASLQELLPLVYKSYIEAE